MLEKIQNQIKEAMRAKDQIRLTTLRGILAAFTNELVAQKKKPSETLADKDMIAVVRRIVKQHKDSIEQFEKGGRQDLVDNEKAELKILEEFLPAQMSEDQVRKIVEDKKEELGITDKGKMGILMGAVMKECGGEADGSLVKRLVDEVLN